MRQDAELNLVAALKMGLIDWFKFFELWKQLDERNFGMKYIKGSQLTAVQKNQVKNLYRYRWTTENQYRGQVWQGLKNEKPLESDDSWLNRKAFPFTDSGNMPDYMNTQPIPVELAGKTSAEIKAWLEVRKTQPTSGIGDE